MLYLIYTDLDDNNANFTSLSIIEYPHKGEISMNENEETVTVTVVFDNNEQRSQWLRETIVRDFPQHQNSANIIASEPMAKNITLKLNNSNEGDSAEEQNDGQLQLPFGRPLNCS